MRGEVRVKVKKCLWFIDLGVGISKEESVFC